MKLSMRLIHLTIVALALVAAGCSGSSSDTSASSESSEATQAAAVEEVEGDFAGLVDIGGGRQMYMECSGTGSPTVVLESGLRDAADVWSMSSAGEGAPTVFPEVADFTRVCAYDRPGTVVGGESPSRSDSVSQPTTAQDAVADLHALLSAAEEPGPYVLVGHSYGGPIIRLYASAHPPDVAGLVLVDALSEDLPNGLTPTQQALFEEINTPPPDTDAEVLDLQGTFQQLRESPPVPQVPTIVLTADQPQLTAEVLAEGEGQLPAGVDQEFADALWAAQLAAQDELAKMFPGVEHITNTNSTHYIHNEQPQLVIDAIRQVVDASRDNAEIASVVEGVE